MTDRRHKNTNWQLPPVDGNNAVATSAVTNALLMDIRDELQLLNGLISCPNFVNILVVLRSIDNKLIPRKRKASTRA